MYLLYKVTCKIPVYNFNCGLIYRISETLTTISVKLMNTSFYYYVEKFGFKVNVAIYHLC